VAVVPLPMSIGRFSGAGELAKVIAIHLGGWLASIFSTVAIVRTLLRRGGEKRSKEESPPTRRSSPQVEAAAADAEAIEAEQGKRAAALAVAAQAKAHRLAVRQAWTSFTALSFAALPWLSTGPALLCTTMASLLHAERLPVTLQRAGLHPLVVSACVTMAVTFTLGDQREYPCTCTPGPGAINLGVAIRSSRNMI